MILKTSKLSIGYQGKSLIDDLGLSLKSGELTCLLGPNGSGKSTLLHTLIGTLKPIQGEVMIQGKSIAQQSPHDLARLISVVLSQKLTPVNLSVYEIVALGRTPYTNWLGHLSPKDKKAVRSAMELVNMVSYASRFISEISDGERQRTMIAKALAQDTPIMILDEPTAHLDVNHRAELLTLLKTLAKETQKAILLSTHELDMALQLADSIWLINPRVGLTSGTPEDLALEGAITSTFRGERVTFNEQTGSFKIRYEKSKKIALSGRGTAVFWTRKALEKEGYEIVPHQNGGYLVQVKEGEKRSWYLKGTEDAIEAHSISELKDILRRLPVAKNDSSP